MADAILRENIEAALQGHNADYIEVRLEENAATWLSYRGKDLEDIGRTTNLGGNVRALYKGGWGFVSFNDLSHLRGKVAAAAAQARLAGTERSELAPVPAVVDVVEAYIVQDARTVPLAQKKRILDEYSDLIWATPKIQTSTVGYGDPWKRVVFASTEGSYIDQSKVDVTLRVVAVARQDGDVQQSGFSIGRLGDYSFVELQHAAVRAVELLSAPAVKGGEYTVVLDPILAGVFCHEAFGHLSESDFVYEKQQMRDIMVLGKRFGRPLLNIVDGAAVPGLRCSFKYDDEGTPARRRDLIRKGVLVGRLHSRETAGKMSELSTGNARY